MIKLILVIFPLFIMVGGPIILNHYHIVSISDWYTFVGVIIVSTFIVAVKVSLSDYVEGFSIEGHSLQISEMALMAFIATVSLQMFNETSILTNPNIFAGSGIPIEFLGHFEILGAGIVLSVLILILTAFLVKEIRIKESNEQQTMYIRRGVCYFIGLIGYTLYVSLFLYKAIS